MAGCVACSKPLIMSIEPDEEEAGGSATDTGLLVDDDVQLQCGCHFHWQCLLDAYSMTECPQCGTNLISTTNLGVQNLLCTLKNEGGLQENLDILPILTEESYLKAYPEERKCRAFLEFCGEGDIEAIIDLLDDQEDDDEGDEEDMTEKKTVGRAGSKIDVLRYQDQIGSMGSGLHIAIQNLRVEVAWLLIFLASTLDISKFPQDVLEAAHNFGLSREDQRCKVDIRSLKDAESLTAEQRAARIEGVWDEWLRSGRLKSSDNFANIPEL